VICKPGAWRRRRFQLGREAQPPLCNILKVALRPNVGAGFGVCSLPFAPTSPSLLDLINLLVLVTDPERTPTFPDSVLHALYGLTPAETEVANGLLMGYSLKSIGRRPPRHIHNPSELMLFTRRVVSE